MGSQLGVLETAPQDTEAFSYARYTRIVRWKLCEVVPKEFVRFVLLGTAQTRRYFWERLGLLLPTLSALSPRRPVWIHANSYGEVLASRPLLKALHARVPAAPLIVSTGNFTADTEAQRLTHCDGVFFAPYDSPGIVARVLRQLRPRCLLFVEADLWPNLLRGCVAQGVPVAVVSGRYMDLRYWFDRRIPLTAEVFNLIAQYCMQSQADAERLRAVAPQARICVTGNLKLDVLRQPDDDGSTEISHWREGLRLTNGAPVWVAGSVHPGEDEAVIDAYVAARARCPQLTLLLAPRYPEHADRCERLLTARGLRVFRRSALGRGRSRADEEVILLDTLGELRRCYTLGTVAFVGGSLVPEPWVPPGFACEGHNPLEPIACGKAVLFGPRMGNFATLAQACLEHGLGWRIESAEQLAQRVVEVVQNVSLRADISKRSAAFLAGQPWVAEQTVAAVQDLVTGGNEST